MLHDLAKIQNYDIAAEDGAIGRVYDAYVDDRYWTMRYLVVDTGNWLTGRKVLIATAALSGVDHDQGSFSISLSRQQIKDSPPMEDDLPVSRQHEQQIHDHFSWPYYWAPFSLGIDAAALPLPVADEDAPAPQGDPNLRSVREIGGYEIHAENANIGHVDTFLADDERWRVPYFVIDTGHWLPGRKVLIGTDWIDDVDWSERRVTVNLTRQMIESSPAYNPSAVPDRDYEERLHRHYQRPSYWDS